MTTKKMIQKYNELEKLSNVISEISGELSEVARFSPKLDAWWDQYEYGGYMDAFADDDPEEAQKLINEGIEIIENYRDGSLRLGKVKIAKHDVVQIRKKATSKAKPKRKPVKKVVKKCKCK